MWPNQLFVVACGARIPDIAVYSVLGGIVVVGILLSALLYLPYRKLIRRFDHNPATQLAVAVPAVAILIAASGFGALFGGAVLGFALAELFKDIEIAAYSTLVFVGVLGVALWARVYRTRSVPAAGPQPRWQIQLQDLLVASVCFAIGLTILSQKLGHPEDVAEFAPYASFLLVVGTLGLFIGIDVCRYSPIGKQPLSRAAVFAAIFTFMPLAWFIVLPVWVVRRRHWTANAPASAEVPVESEK